MVKISADLISRSSQFLNPVKEFQLDLRGYKITVIENLTATNDQFGCIDLTDNSITKIDQLPKLNRLRSIFLINNRVSKIDPNFAIDCPYLENLILSNNKISSITEIDNLATCKTLVRLSLLDNLVTKIKYYRLYTIWKIPNLRVLDFQRVRLKEKLLAKNIFETEKGIQMIDDMKNKKFQAEEDEEYVKELEKTLKDEEKKKKIYNLIKNFTSLEEIRKLEKSLQSGNIEKDFLNPNQKEDYVYNQDN